MTPGQWIDLALGLLVALGAWAGWRQGVLAATVELATLAIAFVAALVLHRPGVQWVESLGWDWGVWTAPAVFVAVFVLVRVVLGVPLGMVLRKLPPRAHTHGAARVLGLLPGAANGLLNATIVASIVLALPADNAFTRAVAGSEGARILAGPADWLEAQLGPVFTPAAEKALSRLTVQPESKESIQLPFRVADGRERPELEARMLELVNGERAKEGLRALAPDPDATAVARAHSRDMLARSYFSHVTPDGLDPGDRARRGNLAFRITGENLALARNLPMAHQGLMNSPGHRANILKPAYGRLGIGVIDAGRHGIVVTQVFRN
jgi:uncharacterized protein YkwD